MNVVSPGISQAFQQLSLDVSKEQLAAAAKEAQSSDRSVIRVLVDLALVGEEDLLQQLAGLLDVRFLRLEPDDVSAPAAARVPAKVVEHYGVMPVSVDNGTLEVAVSDPFDREVLDELAVVVGAPIRAALATAESIARAIRRHYGVGAETIERLMAEEGNGAALGTADVGTSDLAEQSEAESASVIKLVNQVLLDAIRERATDIHLEPFEDELRVRYRVDGVLREANVPPAARHFRFAIVSRIKIMASLDIAEKRLPQDGRAQVRLASEEFDLRISILPVPGGEAVNIRILPRRSVFGDLASLGLDGRDLELVEDLLARPHGIILVTGPTGSGKTTSLYACLTRLNRPQTKILTIEDPIEYRIRGVQQMQVAPEIGFTFARALRSMLRHDPDVMLIGEVRDTETARITIRTALTGHLVFSTLHANDAAGATTRLMEMGIESYLIASSLIGVLAQRLVRTVCHNCREPYTPSERVLNDLCSDADAAAGLRLFRGRGCEECRLTGYRGRTAICEILMVDNVVRELVASASPAGDIRTAARQCGMRTLREAGWEKVKRGLTTVEEVLRVTQDEADET